MEILMFLSQLWMYVNMCCSKRFLDWRVFTARALGGRDVFEGDRPAYVKRSMVELVIHLIFLFAVVFGKCCIDCYEIFPVTSMLAWPRLHTQISVILVVESSNFSCNILVIVLQNSALDALLAGSGPFEFCTAAFSLLGTSLK
jgi:hypothetical protein